MRALTLALAVALAAAGCSAPMPEVATPRVLPAPGGTVVEAVVGEASTLNPLFEQEDNARDIDSLVYQGLTGVGPDESVRMVLAKDMVVSSDHLSYTFDLRPGVRWADGQPFTADDVMFTFGVLQSQAYQVPTQQSWKEIKIEQLGPTTVRFTLKAPSASFPLALRQGIVPKHIFSGLQVEDMASDPHSQEKAFGTGPFQVKSISRDRRTVVLARNPYAQPAPFLDAIEFRSYPSLSDAVDAVARGEADAVGSLALPQLGSLAKRPDLVVRQIRTYAFVAVLFDLSVEQAPLLDPPAVRQALAKAIDRQRIVDQVLGGRADPDYGPIPPTDWAYSKEAADRIGYDPQGAARLLEEAGWVLDPQTGIRVKANRTLSLTLVTADGYPYRPVAEAVSAQLRAVGVEVRVEPVSASALVSKYLMRRQYQLALAAVDNGPDPDEFSLWHSNPAADSLNFSGPLVPHQALIDKDLEDGRAASDRKARKQAYADFQDLMVDAAPAVFLFEPHYVYLVSRRVRGLRTNPVIEPVDRFQYVAEWYVNSKGA